MTNILKNRPRVLPRPLCYQPEHIFALKQPLVLYAFYQARVEECDAQIEHALTVLNVDQLCADTPMPRRHRTKQPEEVGFDVRAVACRRFF